MYDSWRPDPSIRRITAEASAEMVRAAVTTAFPGVRFWIRCSFVSPLVAHLIHPVGLNVRWIEGPAEQAVAAVASPYDCTDGWDAQIDWSGFLRTHWLMPDGSVSVAERAGSQRHGGRIPPSRTPRPHPAAEEVFLHCSVGCRRYRPDQWFMQTEEPERWV